MTTKELLEIFNKFIENDFKHLRTKVDWLFYTIIGGLITIISLLVFKK